MVGVNSIRRGVCVEEWLDGVVSDCEWNDDWLVSVRVCVCACPADE